MVRWILLQWPVFPEEGWAFQDPYKEGSGRHRSKIERADAGLLNKDYPINRFFDEYLARTKAIHSASYHDRNSRVIENFRKFFKKERPYLSKLSQLRPEVIEAYQRYRMKQVTKHGNPIKKRTVNIEVSSLKTFLNKAVKWDMLAKNPMANVDYLKEDDSKHIRASNVSSLCH